MSWLSGGVEGRSRSVSQAVQRTASCCLQTKSTLTALLAPCITCPSPQDCPGQGPAPPTGTSVPPSWQLVDLLSLGSTVLLVTALTGGKEENTGLV